MADRCYFSKKIKSTSNEKKISVLSIFLITFFSCERESKSDEADAQANYNFDIIWEDTGITKDENGFYHLDIDRNNWQTLYRVRGVVTKNDVIERIHEILLGIKFISGIRRYFRIFTYIVD